MPPADCGHAKTCAKVDWVRAPQVNCLEGSTFMVSDLIGDVGPDPDQVFGLFYRDMRHLSRWHLAIDGETLEILSNGATGYPSATFFLAGPGSVYHNPTVSVIRERTLGKGSGEDSTPAARKSSSSCR